MPATIEHSSGAGRMRNSLRIEVPRGSVGYGDPASLFRKILNELLGVRRDDVYCYQEVDAGKCVLTLASKVACQNLYKNIRKEIDNPLVDGVTFTLLYDGLEVPLVVYMFNPYVPTSDIELFLYKYCSYVKYSHDVIGRSGFWNGKRKFFVRFLPDPEGVEGLRHPPSTVLLGRDRGYLFYDGMPVYCRRCGDLGHVQDDCQKKAGEAGGLCRNCGQWGHATVQCPKEKTCSICGVTSHLFGNCPHRKRAARRGPGEPAASSAGVSTAAGVTRPGAPGRSFADVAAGRARAGPGGGPLGPTALDAAVLDPTPAGNQAPPGGEAEGSPAEDGGFQVVGSSRKRRGQMDKARRASLEQVREELRAKSKKVAPAPGGAVSSTLGQPGPAKAKGGSNGLPAAQRVQEGGLSDSSEGSLEASAPGGLDGGQGVVPAPPPVLPGPVVVEGGSDSLPDALQVLVGDTADALDSLLGTLKKAASGRGGKAEDPMDTSASAKREREDEEDEDGEKVVEETALPKSARRASQSGLACPPTPEGGSQLLDPDEELRMVMASPQSFDYRVTSMDSDSSDETLSRLVQ